MAQQFSQKTEVCALGHSGAMSEKLEAGESESPLKRMREAAGLSQQELASRMGVGVTTISRWERGASPATMTVPQIRALCRELGIAFEDLPDEFGPPERPT